MLRLVLPLLAIIAMLVAPTHTVNAAVRQENAQVLEDINWRRSIHGVPPIYLDDRLSAKAEQHSVYMADRNSLEHSKGNEQFFDEYSRVGENVGYGSTVQEVNEAFYDSPGHRKNIVGDYTHLGIGTHYRNGRWWVTVIFGKGNPAEGSEDRVNRIVEQVRTGQRDLINVRHSVDRIAGRPYQNYSNTGDGPWTVNRYKIEERVRGIFANRGVTP